MGIDRKKEEYFPRGGSTGEKIKKKRTFVFEKKERNQPVKLGKRERNKIRPKQVAEEEELVVHTPRFVPARATLAAGAKALCCVKEVRTLNVDSPLIVSIPGRFEFEVEKTNIPWFKNNFLNDTAFLPLEKPSFNKVFTLGSILCCKVLSLKDSKYSVGKVSLDPVDINSDLTAGLINKGDKLFVSVQTVEDHVYTLTTGVPGVTALLPKAEAESFKEENNIKGDIQIGQNLWCVVVKCTELGATKTIEVSIDSNKVSQACLRKWITIDKLNPGTVVDATVVKIFDTGLTVKVVNSEVFGLVEDSHLQTPRSKPSDYEIGAAIKLTVLCKNPLTNQLYFTFRPTESLSLRRFKFGDICENARVLYTCQTAVYLELPKGVSISRGVKLKEPGEEWTPENMAARFPQGKQLSVRIFGYDFLQQTHFCSTKAVTHNKSNVGFQPGAIVEVIIKKHVKAGCMVSVVPKLTGAFIPDYHLSDSKVRFPEKKFPVDSKHKGRVLSWHPEKQKLIVTLKEALVKNPPLVVMEDAKEGESYYGIVRSDTAGGVELAFYQDLRITIPLHLTPKRRKKYFFGQLVKCYAKRDGLRTVFSLIPPDLELSLGQVHTLKLVKINEKDIEATIGGEDFNTIDVILPIAHLSDHYSLCRYLVGLYQPGTKVPGAVLYSMADKDSKPLFSLKESVKTFFKKHLDTAGTPFGMEVPCTALTIYPAGALLLLPIPDFNVKVFQNNELLYEKGQERLKENQGVLAKVTSEGDVSVTLSCLWKDLPVTQEWIAGNLRSYLEEFWSLHRVEPGQRVKARVVSVSPKVVLVSLASDQSGILRRRQNCKNLAVGNEIVATVIFEDLSTSALHLVYNNPHINKKQEVDPSTFTLKEKVCCTVLDGNDYFMVGVVNDGPKSGQLIYIPLRLHPNATGPCLTSQQIQFFNIYEVTISLVTESVVIGLFSKRVYNKGNEDSRKVKKEVSEKIEELSEEEEEDEDEEEEEINEESDEDYRNVQIKEEIMSEDEEVKPEELSMVLERVKKERRSLEIGTKRRSVNPFTVVEDSTLTSGSNNTKNRERKDSVSSDEGSDEVIKRERSESESSAKDQRRKNTFTESDIVGKVSPARKRQASDSEMVLPLPNIKKKKMEDLSKLSLEEAGSFMWDATPDDLAKVVSRADNDAVKEESDDEKEIKKLTPAEKKAYMKQREMEIREKEQQLLDCESNPKSADHFDRLLLTSPDSSLLWIKYMAFHLQATEIEKARAVAKRALKTINIREEEERLNVWMALLNLENLYSSPDVFKETLSEAVRLNDEYKVYTKVLEIYTDSDKNVELEQLTNTMARKFREKEDCWLNCMTALMNSGLVEKARHYLQRALTNLPTKQHVSLISKFALLENKTGHTEEAQALFENVLTSYPARVDIWSVYVDMLVKGGSIQVARNVLERAGSQKLAARKMKTIFSKWLAFEEAHGSQESVMKVKQAALDYVNNITKSAE